MPSFSWHDWLSIATWCSSAPDTYLKSLEFTFTNLSPVAQNVTLKCTARNLQTGSAANPTQTLRTFSTIEGTTTEYPGAGGTPLTHSFVIPPNGTAFSNCFAGYRGPANGGDWHLRGTFEIEISVVEDRGALTGVLNSTFENTCAVFTAGDPIGLSIMSLRNTPRTILINGGRPF